MADQPRPTKKERRAQARAERKRRELEAARRARRRRIINGIVTVVVVGIVVAIVVTAFTGRERITDTVLVDFAAAEEARSAAGCQQLEVPPILSREHLDPAGAPDPAVLYASLRPSAGGPHFSAFGPVATFSNPADERAVVHNLEHGSVVVWYDPARVDGDTVAAIEAWADRLNASGFANSQSGAGIITSPYDGPFTSGKPIAFRAWGVALDCDRFDETVANAFVIDHFGTHGIAPEGNFGPFPEDVLSYDPATLPTETPAGGTPTGSTESPAAETPTGPAETPGGETPTGPATPQDTSTPSPATS